MNNTLNTDTLEVNTSIARQLYADQFGTDMVTLQSLAFTNHTEFRVSINGKGTVGYLSITERVYNPIGTDTYIQLGVNS